MGTSRRSQRIAELAAAGEDPLAEAKRKEEASGDVQRLVLDDNDKPTPLAADFPFVADSSTDGEKSKGKSDRAERRTARSIGRTASERELAALGEQLEEKISVVFGLSAGIAPVTSVYAIENQDKAIRALLGIAKRRPAVLKALSKVADGADALEIGRFLLGILVCIQVDTQRLRGDEIQCRAFGVTEVLERHFVAQDAEPQPGVANENIVVTGGITDAGPRFSPI